MSKEITTKLSTVLSPRRLKHSVGVSETAIMLAGRYGADADKARLAGLLHDCAREMPKNILLQTAETFGILVTDVDKMEPMLLHGPVGACIARRDYGIVDQEILQAIACHTTGGPIMSLLDNIIFLADYIEPGRSFAGVDTVRVLARQNLRTALLAAYDQTLAHLITKRGLIHQATFEGRNALLLRPDK